MLCVKCKKNQAIKTYEQIRNGKKEYVYFCLKCAEMQFGEASCSYCGTTLAQITKTKLVGCAQCYQTLGEALLPMVVKMQGDVSHKGKCAYKTSQERIKQRCAELSVLAEKCYSENDDRAAGTYEEKIDMLRKGVEEDFVWKKAPKYNP